MSDNTWPGKPGVPMNPETYGAHNLGGYLLIWRPESRDYINHNGNVLPPETARAWPYKGPLSTPAEVEARIAQARRDALEEAARREMPPEFLDWMKRQMPKDTIIGNPEWWAGRIWRAAIHAMKKGEGDE
jgi:hypothetical protein